MYDACKGGGRYTIEGSLEFKEGSESRGGMGRTMSVTGTGGRENRANRASRGSGNGFKGGKYRGNT